MTTLIESPEATHTETTPAENGYHQEAYYLCLAKTPELPWLRALKDAAWARYTSLPYPHRKTEAFRFANVRRTQDHGYCFPKSQSPDALIARSRLIEATAGSLVLVNDEAVSHTVNPDLAAQGVIFLPLREALLKHEALVRKCVEESHLDLGAEKFYALHTALCNNGSFLYVPKGVTIDQPFITYHWAKGEQSSLFPCTYIVAERDSEVSCVDYYETANASEPAFVASSALVECGDNARVFRKYIQNLNPLSTVFHTENTRAGRDAAPITISVNLGGHYARLENALRIEGENANVRLYGLTVAAGKQEFDQRTLQIHAAPHAYSDLLYKNALLEKSRTIFSGMIKVDEIAQQTDAYQTNRNLQLSAESEANSLPGLEILANDVKCSHGATTGRLDESELFYMQSRGITPAEAKRLLVFGFFEEVLEKIDNEPLAESLRTLVHEKFDQIQTT